MKKMTLAITVALATLLASAAQARVDKQDRVLIVVSELQTHGPQNMRGLYNAIEQLTNTVTMSTLGDDYRQIIYLKGINATAARFRSTLQAQSKLTSVKAIDVIFSLHGANNTVYFREGGVSMQTLLTQMTTPTAAMTANQIATMKRKLRMVYNLSCFGQSHNNEFRSMGFDVSVGSIGINANAEVEFAPVLTQWSFGWEFQDTFNASNNDVALALADGPVRVGGMPANSRKVFAGRTSVTISSDPLN